MRFAPATIGILATAACCFNTAAVPAPAPPPGFAYLHDVAPSILQDMRYAGFHNFVGRPIEGYLAPACVLTNGAARALSGAEADLARKGLSLVVFDCYRPTRAVADFLAWSRDISDTRMSAEFYPRTDKTRLFELGYLARRSAHSRGSTVDLAIVPAALSAPPKYDPAAPIRPCTAPKGERFEDGTIDFGTGYDCLDALATTISPTIGKAALENRQLLRSLMQRSGFKPYAKEWWHFELLNEPFPGQSFDFAITQPEPR